VTSDLEESSYQWQRRYIFAATMLLIAALIAALLLVL
jgi:hypothetical protein